MNTHEYLSTCSTKNPTLGKPNTSENRTIDAVRRGFGLDRFDCIFDILTHPNLSLNAESNNIETIGGKRDSRKQKFEITDFEITRVDCT